MEVESVDEGTVAKLVVAAGTEGVKVNALIAILAADGEDVAAAASGGGAAPAAKPEAGKAEAAKTEAAPAKSEAAPGLPQLRLRPPHRHLRLQRRARAHFLRRSPAVSPRMPGSIFPLSPVPARMAA